MTAVQLKPSVLTSAASHSVRWGHPRTDGGYVYWMDAGDVDRLQIYRMPRTGGTLQTVATLGNDQGGSTSSDFVVGDSAVFIRTGEGVWQAPKTGGSVKALWQTFLGYWNDQGLIAADSKQVYVTEQSAGCSFGTETLYAVSKANGDEYPVAEFSCPKEIAVDDQYVYVSVVGTSEATEQVDGGTTGLLGKYPNAALLRVQKMGGTPEVLARVPYGLRGIQVTPSYIFGIVTELHADNDSIVRIPIAGGAPEKVGDLGCVMSDSLVWSAGKVYYENSSYYGDEPTLIRINDDGTNLTRFDYTLTALSTRRSNGILVDQKTVIDFISEGEIDQYTLP